MSASRLAMRLGRLAIGLVLVAGLASTVPFGQIVEQQERLEAASRELARIEAENAFLYDEIAALDTPGEIERMAREKLGYVMPGEIPYVALQPEVTVQPTVPPPASVLDRPWWQTLWNFITGADGGG